MTAMEVSEGAVRVLAALLDARAGQQLSPARRWRIGAALRPLVRRYEAESLDELAARVASGREEKLTDDVIEALLNHETSFFRDVASFRTLAERGLARLREARAGPRRLRMWSAGCSMGQEAYTLAMIVAERPDLWRDWTIDILGTDISPGAIARACAGRYSQFEIQRGLPVSHMLRRFAPAGDAWQVDDTLRRMVRFRTHNLLDAPPSGRFDVVLCRNVLLYFSGDVRRLVFGRIAGAIADDGVMMLGAGETAMGQTDQFVSDYACRGLYRPRVDASVQAETAVDRRRA